MRICRMHLWEKEKGGDEALALILYRSVRYQPGERLCETTTTGDHQSVHQCSAPTSMGWETQQQSISTAGLKRYKSKNKDSNPNEETFGIKRPHELWQLRSVQLLRCPGPGRTVVLQHFIFTASSYIGLENTLQCSEHVLDIDQSIKSIF